MQEVGAGGARRRALRIAVIAHVRHPVAEPYMGGMEAHAALLCDALRAAGHRVTLFAAAGSADVALDPLCAAYETVLPWAQHRGTLALDQYQADAFARGWARIRGGGFDVVHDNALFPGLIDWAARDGVPMLVSQHVPPFGAMRDAVARANGVAWIGHTVASASQRPLWAGTGAQMAVVPNGVDCSRWRPGAAVRDTLVWYGRITPNKGPAQAVAAARAAGARLLLAGPIEDADYFAAHIAPQLGPRIRYCGHVSGAALVDLVAAARGVLVTPMWDEPFGLVAAEALACGVPVAAFDRGAMREVVGPCGLVVPAGDVAALAAACGRLATIDRAACRVWAQTQLSVAAMIAGYEAGYAAVMAGAGAETDENQGESEGGANRRALPGG